MFRPTKTQFFLFLILSAFLCRELFLVTNFPLFTGQDEARHYNTIQWITQDQDYNCIQNNDTVQDKDNLATYRFSEEIRQTSTAANLSTWREGNYQKVSYSPGNSGINESLLQEQKWTKATNFCPPDIVPVATKFSFFHWTGNLIESTWDESDIMIRFYLIRILSIFLGATTILLSYFAIREAGFSNRISLLISFIISLQPRLSIYTTNINYDVLLIPCFALFLWAGLHLIRRGVTITSLVFLTIALIGAVLTKGTGLVLIGGIIFLGIWLLFKKQDVLKKIPIHYWIITLILGFTLIITIKSIYNIGVFIPQLSLSSLFEYLGKSLPKIPSSSESFWGTMSWNESNLGPWFVFLIWFIEAIALYGLVRYFYLKESFSFLPTKSVAIFCIIIFFSLQLGVRIHDWQIFQQTGSLVLGTPGRYFLPTLLPQLILVAIGLGALLRQKLALERVLVALAVIMLTFNLYTTWLIIIPRFYL